MIGNGLLKRAVGAVEWYQGLTEAAMTAYLDAFGPAIKAQVLVAHAVYGPAVYAAAAPVEALMAELWPPRPLRAFRGRAPDHTPE